MEVSQKIAAITLHCYHCCSCQDV